MKKTPKYQSAKKGAKHVFIACRKKNKTRLQEKTSPAHCATARPTMCWRHFPKRPMSMDLNEWILAQTAMPAIPENKPIGERTTGLDEID
jgi:hypothetical protein